MIIVSLVIVLSRNIKKLGLKKNTFNLIAIQIHVSTITEYANVQQSSALLVTILVEQNPLIDGRFIPRIDSLIVN